MEEEFKELQLLPTAQPTAPPSSWPLESSSVKFRSTASDMSYDGPSLDLQLSISVRPIRPPPNFVGGVEALKWEAAEQIRLAAIEKAYAERVRELTRREMELAQSEFVLARNTWERTREEVDEAERTKERATRRVDSTCMEITCQSCRQNFRPN